MGKKREEKVPPALPETYKVTGRGLKPDIRYGRVLVSKFINCMMYHGDKATACKVFYVAMDMIEKKLKTDPVEVFEAAINNVKPMIEVKSRRVGGATWQVPVEVTGKRQLSLAIRWLLEAVRGKRGRPMSEKLATELMDAAKKEGAAMTKRENTHKMAEANKAFSHFAY